MHYEFELQRCGRPLTILGVMLFALVLFGLPASPALAQTDLYDCSDFTFQEDAQRILDQNPSDPYGLDGDNDGMACDDLPSRGDSTSGGSTTAVRNQYQSRGQAQNEANGGAPQ